MPGLMLGFMGLLPQIAVGATTALSDLQREQLRFRLDNLFNEVDLAVQNRRADELDLGRQAREMRAVDLYQRIPLKEDLTGLRKELEVVGRKDKVRVHQLKVLSRSSNGEKPPRIVYTNTRPQFHLSENQLVEKIRVQLTVSGTHSAVQEWTAGWREDLIRIVELDSSKGAIRAQGTNRWIVNAVTYRFRNVKFPTLRPGDPLKLLPEWARKQPSTFAAQEPKLWAYVGRIQSITPLTTDTYRVRSEFLLNDARMSFFISKVFPKHR